MTKLRTFSFMTHEHNSVSIMNEFLSKIMLIINERFTVHEKVNNLLKQHCAPDQKLRKAVSIVD